MNPRHAMRFSALQRAENSSKLLSPFFSNAVQNVSVLFSEPKIPQIGEETLQALLLGGFSALQRAENSSKESMEPVLCRHESRFSALQRAENSSKYYGYKGSNNTFVFQCSSASRKFLKKTDIFESYSVARSFSALQRAENSSNLQVHKDHKLARKVSVLFSEPKIPQNVRTLVLLPCYHSFQCSSASRKFLNL